MRCSKCGLELADGVKFCRFCGAKVEEEKNEPVAVESVNTNYQDNYSIPEIKTNANVAPIIKEEPTQFYEDVVKEKKSSSKGKTVVIVFLVLIILAMAGFFGYVFLFNDGKIPFVEPATQPTTEAVTEETTEPVTEALAEVPSVAGGSYQLALQRISDAGLQETHTFEYSDIVAKNCVISQDPKPGTNVKKGTTVKLVVSKGIEGATAPSTVPKETTSSGTNSQVTSAVVSSSAYIIPDSNSKYLTINDIKGMSADELGLARNEIFARHGRIFQNSTYKNYFNSKSWYNGTIAPEDFNNGVLNKYESANASFLSDQEDYMLANGKLNNSLTSAN